MADGKWTAAHALAESGNVHGIRQIFGADDYVADERDHEGLTPLMVAADGGHEEVVIELLTRGGARVNCPDTDGNTALLFAAENDNWTQMRVLIERNADVNYANKAGITPLHAAAIARNHNAVKILLDSGADPFARDSDDMTPIEYLAGSKTAKMAAEFLVKEMERGHTAHTGAKPVAPQPAGGVVL